MRPSRLLAGASLIAIVQAISVPASADPLTWNTTPTNSTYGNGANWNAGSAPSGSATGHFGATSISALTISTATSLGGWTFDADAAAYTITANHYLTFTGTGITVDGGSVNLVNNFYTYFQNASSAGSSTINNALGYLSFQNSSSAASATINNNIYVLFQNSSTAANASITSNGGSAGVFFSGTSTAGNATITVNGGTLSFEGTSTAGNASITNNATMSLIGNSSAGSATIANSGTIFFQGSSSGGTAAITNTPTGVIDFSSTTGVAGDNPNTIGSLAGAGAVYLASNQVTIGGNHLSTDFTGAISDCGASGSSCYATYFGGSTGGALVKTGTGTLTLSGINTYTGATTVDAGTLSVNGSIATSSMTTVNTGATLGGSGTVGNTIISAGGTLAPGNSIGTLNVTGNLAFASGATYAVEVSPSNADRVNVTGIATLGGAAVNASFANGSYVTKQYTIINATGGVSGTFGSQVDTNLPSNFTSKLSYDANNAYLDLTLNYVPPSAPSFGNGLSPNQNAVGNTLVNYFNSNGGIPLAFGALTSAGLTQASGETNVGTQQPGFTAATQFVGAVSDPTVGGRGVGGSSPMGFAAEGDPMDAYAYASTGRKRSGSERDAYAAITKALPRAARFEPRWNLWVSGFGGTQTTDGNASAGTNTSSSRIAGAAVGADYWLSPETVAGFALAGGATNYSVVGGGSGRSDLFQLGGFVRHAIGAGYVTATAAYGWQGVSTDRMVGAEQLRANFNTNSYTARLEGGHRFAMPSLGGVGITPYAAVQVTYLDLPAYAESAASGTGTFALAYAAKGITAPRTELGLRSDKSFAVNDAVLTLRGRAAWAHDTNTERSASATFQSLPGASFVVNGARPAANAALTTAEAEWRFVSGISVGATFEGEFSEVTRSYAGKGVVRYAW